MSVQVDIAISSNYIIHPLLNHTYIHIYIHTYIKPFTADEVAYGFIKIANEAMARPIRNLTTMKGYDATQHALVRCRPSPSVCYTNSRFGTMYNTQNLNYVCMYVCRLLMFSFKCLYVYIRRTCFYIVFNVLYVCVYV